MHHHILVTGHLHEQAITALHQLPRCTIHIQYDLSQDELLDHLANIHVLLTRSSTAVDKKVIDSAPHLKVVARAGVGTGNIDLSYASQKGILVVNAPDKNTTSAAEMTATLLLAMARKLPQAYTEIKQGGWNRHLYTGVELHGKTIGIVGLGSVGSKMARICQGLGMNVIAYDPYLAPQVFHNTHVKRIKSLEKLCEISHVLSLHVPLNQETKGMIRKDHLMMMPPDSFVLNTARGGVIDEKDLLHCLNDGPISACGIDTWENEPEGLNAKLTIHPKVYGTPHIGAATEEAQLAVGITIVHQIRKCLNKQVVDHPVNIPGFHQQGLSSPLQAYMVLAEKLASLAVQISHFQPMHLSFSLPKTLQNSKANDLIALAIQKGFLSPITEEFVSYANASNILAAKGLTIEEGLHSPHPSPSHDNALTFHLQGLKNTSVTLSGVVFDHKHPRITAINHFRFEVKPQGTFLVFKNKDKPGVVGHVGTMLAKNAINIDSFYLSGNKQDGMAMAMVKLSHPLSGEQLQNMRSLSFMEQVRSVEL
ncbi:MAG: phosphoglycerate dehydrogenase [Proteobacteria bacterium]|nr:phosphoglycerate dehydrogenase [Pseudomonadota bacterium]